jgi:putative two-component system response regulator
MERGAKQSILIADDDAGIASLLRSLCEDLGYSVIIARNGREAVEMAMARLPDLVVMDGSMPEKNGFDATSELKAEPSTKHIPIVMLTGMRTREDRLRGIAAGANDFLTKPVDGEEFAIRVANNLKIKEYGDFLLHHADILQAQVEERTREITSVMEDLKAANGLLSQAYLDTIYRLAVVSEFKDEDTGNHIKRIGYYAREMARILNSEGAFTESIFQASMMHDIGKVGIPDSIMTKNGPLSQDEWHIMKKHPDIGGKILSGAESRYLTMAEKVARTHHERWDGSGYPNGLKGEQIPLAGRITAIADNYDALRMARSYKPAFTHSQAMDIIVKGDGRTSPAHFDPDILEAFALHSPRFAKIYDDFAEGTAPAKAEAIHG